MMSLLQLSTVVALLLCLCLMIFQASLAMGAPLGKLAWGGQHRVLPRSLRWASLAAIVLFLFFGLVLAEKAGLIVVFGPGFAGVTAWVIAAYGVIGIGMNAISRSVAERLVMTPVALVLAICAGVIASS